MIWFGSITAKYSDLCDSPHRNDPQHQKWWPKFVAVKHIQACQGRGGDRSWRPLPNKHTHGVDFCVVSATLIPCSSTTSTMGPSSPAPSDAPPGTASTSSAATTYASGALETIPTDAANPYRGKHIPNTPLGASIVSVCLSMVFTLGLLLFLRGPIIFGLEDDQWRSLGFFLACWAGFHWGEYAVCAGWNRARCSVDCELPVSCFVVYYVAVQT